MRDRLLKLLRVSDRPTPPPDSGASLDTFRASKRYFYYTVITWVPKQVVAFAGLVFSLAFLGTVEMPFVRAEGWERFMAKLELLEVRIGPVAVDPTDFFLFFEALAILIWAAQLLFSALLMKLSWELRWYMVGERSLRIREGLWSVREQTMTIANIQNMKVKQGPLQRLLGIADLEVHTAGGAGGQGADGKSSDEGDSSLHTGRFRGLENAQALRDRLRARLVRHKGAGLGDADDLADQGDGSAAELAAAAAALLEETRGLRGSWPRAS